MDRKHLKITAPLGSAVALELHRVAQDDERVIIAGVAYVVAGVTHDAGEACYELVRRD